MLRIHGSWDLRRIVVLNPKGGAGKTTLAFNIAGYLASTGRKVALIDMDRQSSSSHWLGRRPAEFPPVYGVPASSAEPGAHGNHGITLPLDIDFAVVDAPAGVSRDELAEFTAGSHAIIVPVMPSELDIHAASRLIADLLLVARVNRANRRLGVVANRVKERTIAYKQLMKFLDRLSIPVIGVIRDSQNYVSAAREGLCIHELLPSKAGKDRKQWESVTEWLEHRLATPLTERDLRRPKPMDQADEPSNRPSWKLATAAVLALIVASALLWNFARTRDTGMPAGPVAMIDQAVDDDAGDATLAPASDGDAADSEKPPESTTAETESREVVAIEQAVHDDAGDAPLAPASDGVATDSEKPSKLADAEVESREPEPLPTSDALRQKWRLSGVAQSGGAHVVLLIDPSDSSTRTVTAGIDLDGWRLKDAGRDFAILAKNGEEVRLQLSKQDAESRLTVSP
jgi:chromosome partitioning protein